MKTQTNNKLLYVLGKCLGQPLAWILRKQKRLANWLIAKGLSAKFVKLLLLIVNLVFLAILLLIILPSWIVVGIAVFMLIAYIDVDIDAHKTSKNRYEYRGGTDGFGKYDNQFGYRVDAGSIEDEE